MLSINTLSRSFWAQLVKLDAQLEEARVEASSRECKDQVCRSTEVNSCNMSMPICIDVPSEVTDNVVRELIHIAHDTEVHEERSTDEFNEKREREDDEIIAKEFKRGRPAVEK